MTFAELQAALRTFGMTERDTPTMSQVKRRQRELIRSCHPDLNPPPGSRTAHDINAAAAVILSYLQNYRFSFNEDEFYRQNPDERLRMQFANDPVWGGGP